VYDLTETLVDSSAQGRARSRRFFYRRENPGGGLAEAELCGSAVEALRPAREVEERWALRGGPGVTATPAPWQRARESGIGPQVSERRSAQVRGSRERG
jgi:hypothetical protein